MAKTVTLTKPIILQIVIVPTPGNEHIRVMYTLTDDTGKTTQPGEMFFWRNLPPPPPTFDGSTPVTPDNWIQVPLAVKTGIGDLLTYITNKIAAMLDPAASPKKTGGSRSTKRKGGTK